MNSGERLLWSVQLSRQEHQVPRKRVGQVRLQLLLVVVLLAAMALVSAMGPAGPEGLAADESGAEPLIGSADAAEILPFDALPSSQDAGRPVTAECRFGNDC
jgi:hypothetical protein